jgi:hypothetical protein
MTPTAVGVPDAARDRGAERGSIPTGRTPEDPNEPGAIMRHKE